MITPEEVLQIYNRELNEIRNNPNGTLYITAPLKYI